MSALAVLLLALAPVPYEHRGVPTKTAFGQDLIWVIPDRHPVAYRDMDNPHVSWPAPRWASRDRKTLMGWHLVGYDIKSNPMWRAYCDDPSCPHCAGSIYERRR